MEQAALKPLPGERFDTMRTLSAKVDAKARVCVLQAHYSVSACYAGRKVEVRLGARHLEIVDPARGAIVAVWPRSLSKVTAYYALDHYLEVLVRKPGALPRSTALAAGPPKRRVHPTAPPVVGHRPTRQGRRGGHPPDV